MPTSPEFFHFYTFTLPPPPPESQLYRLRLRLYIISLRDRSSAQHGKNPETAHLDPKGWYNWGSCCFYLFLYFHISRRGMLLGLRDIGYGKNHRLRYSNTPSLLRYCMKSLTNVLKKRRKANKEKKKNTIPLRVLSRRDSVEVLPEGLEALGVPPRYPESTHPCPTYRWLRGRRWRLVVGIC